MRESLQISCLGKNGMAVNDKAVTVNDRPVELRNKTKVRINSFQRPPIFALPVIIIGL
jgi:hypothetical protein